MLLKSVTVSSTLYPSLLKDMARKKFAMDKAKNPNMNTSFILLALSTICVD